MENQNLTSKLSDYLKDKNITPPNDLPQIISEITIDMEKIERWSKK